MENKKIFGALFLLCLLLCQAKPASAQDELEYPDFKGIIVESEDETSTKVKFNFRMQSRMDLSSINSEDLSPTELLFRIRRLRLKASGHLLNPRLKFKVELGFAPDDVDGLPVDLATSIYDAYIQYALYPNLGIRFGQFKLPGNRERVISSMSLAFIDRSILNSAYNIDRDAGLMLLFEENIGQAQFHYMAALTNGEGPNFLSYSMGPTNEELNLAITQRVEFLPFGEFEDGGDYFEADLLREETPKLSIGAGYSHNNDAIRLRGQRSGLLYEPRTINTTFADLMFKYQGWSLLAEYMKKDAENPVTIGPDQEERAVRNGDGYMIQGGYVWPSMWGLTARYAETTPHFEVNTLFYNAETEARIGLSKYIRGHRIKVQSDIGYLSDKGLPVDTEGFWEWRFQVELGL